MSHSESFDRLEPRRHRRALFLVNRQSRSGDTALEPAIHALSAAGIELVEVHCGSGGDLAHCIMSHRGEVDSVVVGGGDGTINAALRALVDTGLPLGVLPLGTANDFARSVGIPTEITAAARIIADGLTHRVDAGDVNGHLFFNVASVGLAADLAKSLTTERKRRFGRFSYAMSAAHLLLEARSFHATLVINDKSVMVRTLQIAIGNGRFYGGGNAIATHARIDNGFLDLYSLEFAEVWRMALMLPTFRRGTHGALREVRTARAETFEVITRKPRPVNADGELVTYTPAVFTQKKLAVNVFVPEKSPLLTVRL